MDRRKFVTTAVGALVSVPPVAGAATSSAAPDAARSELTPTGKLRGGMNLGNALFTKQDTATGELRGVSVDVMRELASRLNVPVDFVIYKTPADVADAVDRNTWDVAVLAIEPARAEKIAFSPAMTEIEATYVVHKGSEFRSVEQIDMQGVRVSAPARAGYELYLRRTLRNATLTGTSGFPGSFGGPCQAISRSSSLLSSRSPSISRLRGPWASPFRHRCYCERTR